MMFDKLNKTNGEFLFRPKVHTEQMDQEKDPPSLMPTRVLVISSICIPSTNSLSEYDKEATNVVLDTAYKKKKKTV